MAPICNGDFVWDREKALANKRRHGITFQAARRVFLDPLAVISPDSGNGGHEERWLAVGMLKGDVVVVVVHTYDERGDSVRVRIISVRRATKQERLEYDTAECATQKPAMTCNSATDDDEDDGMKEEYDFTNGVRGKHCLPNAIVSFPIYLDNDVLIYFSELAESLDLETRELLNEMLRSQMPGGEKFANVRFPIFIDNRTLGYFHGRAIATGIPGEELINEVLRQYVKAAGYVAPGFSTEPR